MNKKVSIIGAGNVGSACAHLIAMKELADIALIDIKEGIGAGHALDLSESAPVEGFDLNIEGSTGYEITENSDVVVITAGVPRRKDPKTGKFPSRDELVKTNQAIVEGVTEQVAKFSPEAILIIVSNPLDAMCHVVKQVSGFPRERIIGQAGALDTARYKTFIAWEAGVSAEDVSAMVLGGHGDTMVPLPRHTSIAGIPVRELIAEEKLQAIIERTRGGGGEIVRTQGYGGYYAPASGVVSMVESILKDKKRVIPCAVYTQGEYGYKDLFIGLPCVLGAGGIERVLEMTLNDEESAMLAHSAGAVQAVVDVLGYA
jgi:malate dehydrogenase